MWEGHILPAQAAGSADDSLPCGTVQLHEGGVPQKRTVDQRILRHFRQQRAIQGLRDGFRGIHFAGMHQIRVQAIDDQAGPPFRFFLQNGAGPFRVPHADIIRRGDEDGFADAGVGNIAKAALDSGRAVNENEIMLRAKASNDAAQGFRVQRASPRKLGSREQPQSGNPGNGQQRLLQLAVARNDVEEIINHLVFQPEQSILPAEADVCVKDDGGGAQRSQGGSEAGGQRGFANASLAGGDQKSAGQSRFLLPGCAARRVSGTVTVQGYFRWAA